MLTNFVQAMALDLEGYVACLIETFLRDLQGGVSMRALFSNNNNNSLCKVIRKRVAAGDSTPQLIVIAWYVHLPRCPHP